MEKKCVRIVSQQALVERDWTNSQGEKITIASKEMEFSDGIDSFVAEATDQMARNFEKNPLADGTAVNLQLQMTVRKWKSEKTGQDVKATSIRIMKMTAV